jgi:hypothetical protein
LAGSLVLLIWCAYCCSTLSLLHHRCVSL